MKCISALMGGCSVTQQHVPLAGHRFNGATVDEPYCHRQWGWLQRPVDTCIHSGMDTIMLASARFLVFFWYVPARLLFHMITCPSFE